MPVSGVVISCNPEVSREVARKLAREGGVEIHGILDDGRLIAVVESDSVEGEMTIVRSLLTVDGVLDVRLAYHNFEDLSGFESAEKEVP